MEEETKQELQENTEIAESPEATEVPKTRKKRKRPGTRKQRQFINVGILGILALLCLIIVMTLVDVDSRFLRAFDSGIKESWALDNNEIQLKDSEGANDTSFIDAEYDAVKAFRYSTFKDETLGELAAKYISALEGCRSAIEENDPDKDYDTFWSSFSQSYGQRLEAIYDLYTGDYGLEFEDPEYKEELDEMMLSAWSLKKTADIRFTRVRADESEEGAEESRTVLGATVSNDSGFDLEYINIEVELYDEKGELIETATAYANNIKKGADFDLKCYQTEDAKADSYKITSVSCRRKADD